MAVGGGRMENAQGRFEQALEVLRRRARGTRRAGDGSARRGRMAHEGAWTRPWSAWRRLRPARGEERDADVAGLAAQLGRLHIFRGELAGRPADRDRARTGRVALAAGGPGRGTEHQGRDPEPGASAWREEGLVERSLALALEYELPAAAIRAYNNLADTLHRRDRCEEAAAVLEQGLVLARRIGHRHREAILLGELAWSLAQTGRWQAAFELPRARARDAAG